MKLYKLTDAQGRTRNNTHWGEGITVTAKGEGTTLCSAGVVHAYTSLLLAELLDKSHGNYGATKRAWEAEGEVVASDGTKVGCKSLTTVREITADLPVLTRTQRTAFAILCAQAVLPQKYTKWHKWAEGWLSGADRSRSAAYAYASAAYAAGAAAYAAYADADAAARSASLARSADIVRELIPWEAMAAAIDARS